MYVWLARTYLMVFRQSVWYLGHLHGTLHQLCHIHHTEEGGRVLRPVKRQQQTTRSGFNPPVGSQRAMVQSVYQWFRW